MERGALDLTWDSHFAFPATMEYTPGCPARNLVYLLPRAKTFALPSSQGVPRLPGADPIGIYRLSGHVDSAELSSQLSFTAAKSTRCWDNNERESLGSSRPMQPCQPLPGIALQPYCRAC